MSAALVKKGLEIVDPEFSTAKRKKNKGVFDLIPHKLQLKTEKEVSVPTKKYNIVEAKKHITSKEDKIKQNLKKLELLRKSTTIELDKETTKKIIQRAVTRRPIKTKKKSAKSKKTVFTEEDFKKFEEEYLNE